MPLTGRIRSRSTLFLYSAGTRRCSTIVGKFSARSAGSAWNHENVLSHASHSDGLTRSGGRAPFSIFLRVDHPGDLFHRFRGSRYTRSERSSGAQEKHWPASSPLRSEISFEMDSCLCKFTLRHCLFCPCRASQYHLTSLSCSLFIRPPNIPPLLWKDGRNERHDSNGSAGMR